MSNIENISLRQGRRYHCDSMVAELKAMLGQCVYKITISIWTRKRDLGSFLTYIQVTVHIKT